MTTPLKSESIRPPSTVTLSSVTSDDRPRTRLQKPVGIAQCKSKDTLADCPGRIVLEWDANKSYPAESSVALVGFLPNSVC